MPRNIAKAIRFKVRTGNTIPFSTWTRQMSTNGWITRDSIFEVLRSYMVSFAMAALRSVFFIQR